MANPTNMYYLTDTREHFSSAQLCLWKCQICFVNIKTCVCFASNCDSWFKIVDRRFLGGNCKKKKRRRNLVKWKWNNCSIFVDHIVGPSVMTTTTLLTHCVRGQAGRWNSNIRRNWRDICLSSPGVCCKAKRWHVQHVWAHLIGAVQTVFLLWLPHRRSMTTTKRGPVSRQHNV